MLAYLLYVVLELLQPAFLHECDIQGKRYDRSNGIHTGTCGMRVVAYSSVHAQTSRVSVSLTHAETLAGLGSSFRYTHCSRYT